MTVYNLLTGYNFSKWFCAIPEGVKMNCPWLSKLMFL